MEIAFAADRRHADAIAVAADAGDDAGDEMARLRVIGAAEAQRVEIGDRPRAHGEDIAQDAADAGRGALIGLDEGGVVVALDLEHGGLAVADIDDAGILARPADDARPCGRQAPQPFARGFVGAVLAPHHREDAELGEVGLASQDGDGARHIPRRKARAARRSPARSRSRQAPRPGPAKKARPSVAPRSGSVASSGCGMRPSTRLLLVEHAGDVARRAVVVARLGHACRRARNSGRRRGPRLRAGRASRRRRSNCRRDAPPARGSPGPPR